MKDIFDRFVETLALERELGTRTVEIDRALLVAPASEAAGGGHAGRGDVPVPPAPMQSPVPVVSSVPAAPVAPPVPPVPVAAAAAVEEPVAELAFWTPQPLSPAGTALLEKMIAATECPREKVLVNTEGPARLVVLMGSEVCKRRIPERRVVRGMWFEHEGTPTVVTYSPDFILKTYPQGSTGMRVAKREVWTALQGAMARMRQ